MSSEDLVRRPGAPFDLSICWRNLRRELQVLMYGDMFRRLWRVDENTVFDTLQK